MPLIRAADLPGPAEVTSTANSFPPLKISRWRAKTKGLPCRVVRLASLKGVVVGDGAAWIDGWAGMDGPKRVRMVDGDHAVEPLGALGREAVGEGAKGWVEPMRGLLGEGKGDEVVGEGEVLLATRRGWSEGVSRTAEYVRERAKPMRDPDVRAAGYPMGSGVGERGGQGMAGRCKNRGQRWKKKGLVAIRALRSAGMGGTREGNRAWQPIRPVA